VLTPPVAVAAAEDIIIPVVFPDYKISVPSPVALSMPKFLKDRGFTDWKKGNNMVGDLGHAGILIVEGKTGLARYYDYGRYSTKDVGLLAGATSTPAGLVRRPKMPDVRMKGNDPDMASLKVTLAEVAKVGGHGSRIAGAYVRGVGLFAKADKYASGRHIENSSKLREEYSLNPVSPNTCGSFMAETMRAADLSVPMLVDPRPNSYADEIRSVHPDLDYDPKSKTLTIEGLGTF
jgi:hypothetical protein